MTFSLEHEIARVTAIYKDAMSKDAFAELVQDRAAEMITWHDHLATDHSDRLLEIANELYEASSKLIPGWPSECRIPSFLLRPTSGACSHCGQDCDEPDEQEPGQFIHESCHAELVAQQASDDRHNDPRRGQA